MEKLRLVCGRFIPPRGGEAMERVERMEAYLSKLTRELELLVGELDRALAETGGENGASAVSAVGEEGRV